MHGCLAYAAMYGLVTLLQYACMPAVVLLASLHLAKLLYGVGLSWIPASPILTFVLVVWALSEMAFWAYAQRQILKYQRLVDRQRTCPAERLQLFQRCLALIQANDGRQNVERFFSGWFPNARFSDLCRGNIEQWLAWAFFDSKWKDMTQSDRAEIKGYMCTIEQHLGYSLPGGFNPMVKSMRLTLDDVIVDHRPLLYYLVLRAINLGNSLWLYSLGFRRHAATNGAFVYWAYRPPGVDTVDHTPIVFVHGLGIGLGQYINVIHQMVALGQPLLLVEIMHISSQLYESVPNRDLVVEAMHEMLTRNRFSRGIFCGHSYGTVYVSWAIKHRPNMVASAFLADPIVFLLCEKDVCFNFVYRKPKTWVELVLQYFASREIHIAKTLKRHFRWYDNALWSEEMCVRMTVVLSEADRIANATAVRNYLANKPCVEVVWLPGLHHAEFLFKADALRSVMDRLAEHTQFSASPITKRKTDSENVI